MQVDVAEDEVRDALRKEMAGGAFHGLAIIRHIALGRQGNHMQGKADGGGLFSSKDTGMAAWTSVACGHWRW